MLVPEDFPRNNKKTIKNNKKTWQELYDILYNILNESIE